MENIAGLTDVQETMKTIEKIAASSVHMARIQAQNLARYRSMLENTLARLSAFVSASRHPLFVPHTKQGALLVVVTADHGKVGGLWHSITEHTISVSRNYTAIACIGSKGASYLAEHGEAVTLHFDELPDTLDPQAIHTISERLTDLFLGGTYATIDILHAKHEALRDRTTRVRRLYPFSLTTSEAESSMNVEALGFPVFEPSIDQVYQALVTKYAHMLFLSLAAEAKLSELVARTVAMEHATAQTAELIHTSTQAFRRSRREAVTEEQTINMHALQHV